ncbi:MAG: glycosyl transferase family 1, partial [Comamonas sp.]
MKKMERRIWEGVQVVPYAVKQGNTQGGRELLRDLESKIVRAEAAMQAAFALRDEGFSPDVIIAHSGWGEAMFLKQVWPNAKMGLYCEFFYRDEGYDLGFDTAIYPLRVGAQKAQIQLKNAHYLLQAPYMDAGLSPMHFQADTFPEPLRSKIAVIHDGIDTRKIAPNPHAALKFGSGLSLRKGDEVVTFVSRSLEPYR